MAEQNLIQRAEVQQILRKQFDIHDRSVSPTLAFDVQPVFIIPDLCGAAGILRGAGGHSQLAVAAEFGAVVLHNPSNNNAIFSVESILISPAAASEFKLAHFTEAQLGTYTLVGGGSQQPCDTRIGVTGQLWAGSDAVSQAGTAELAWLRIGSSNPFPLWAAGHPLILLPGNGVIAEAQTVNAQFNYSARWTELSIR